MKKGLINQAVNPYSKTLRTYEGKTIKRSDNMASKLKLDIPNGKFSRIKIK